MMPAGPFRTALHRESVADLKKGLRLGLFQVESISAALDLIRGATVMGMRTIIRDLPPPGHAEQIAVMVLRGLGVPDLQAHEAIARELDLPRIGNSESPTIRHALPTR